MLGSGDRVTIRQQCNRWHWCRTLSKYHTHHSSAPDWPWCLTYRLVWRDHIKFSPPPRDVAHCCTDICTGAGLYWQGLWRVSLGERQLLLRSTLTGSLIFIGSVIAVLVKYLSAWDECWGKGIESPSGSNVIDGIGVAPFPKISLKSSTPILFII